MATPCRAGARWRFKADQILPGGRYGDTWNVTSDRRLGGGDGTDRTVETSDGTYHVRTVELPGTELDEIVIGRWLHLEQMDTGTWWLNIAGVTLWIKAARDGNPKSISVYGPGDYAEPVPGCRYDLEWSDPDNEDDTPPQPSTERTPPVPLVDCADTQPNRHRT